MTDLRNEVVEILDRYIQASPEFILATAPMIDEIVELIQKREAEAEERGYMKASAQVGEELLKIFKPSSAKKGNE